MTETFLLLVDYAGVKHEFKSRFERYGYTHRMMLLIGEHTFVFEPDEEGGYRAVNPTAEPVAVSDVHLLRAVAEKLAELSA